MDTSAAMNALATNPGPSAVAYAVAALRRQEMLTEVARDRLIRQARPDVRPGLARRLLAGVALTVLTGGFLLG